MQFVRGTRLAVTDIFFEGSTGTYFDVQTDDVGGGTTIHNNYNGSNSQTEWSSSCRDISGVLPTFIANEIAQDYTFTVDADRVLTPQQSEVAQLHITNSGILTGPHGLQSQLPPQRGRSVLVLSDETQDINWSWATGATATIPAGSRCMMGTIDGVNAAVLMKGA